MPTRRYELGSLFSHLQDSGLKNAWKDGMAVIRAYWYLRKATELGVRVRVWGKPAVSNWGNMRIGDRVRLVSTIATLELVSMPGGELEIGTNTFINYGCSIAANQKISIGPDCSIGTYGIILDNNYHRIEPDHRYEVPESAPVILESRVWLGARVIVLPGVTIGAGSVIGAGSIVTRDIPPLSLAVGNPARVIKKLTDEP